MGKNYSLFASSSKIQYLEYLQSDVQTFKAKESKSSKDWIYKISEGEVLHLGISQGRIK